MQQLSTRLTVYALICVMLAVLLTTYFRVLLLGIYPVLVVFLFLLFRFKLHLFAFVLLALVMLNLLLSFRHGIFIKYNLVSLYFYIPFILLLFARPQPQVERRNLADLFLKALAAVMFLNNIVGFIQYMNNANDDSFVGLYGRFTVTQNGLSLINGVLFYYYLLQFQKYKRVMYLLVSFFFLASCVMGFYGAGLLALLAAIALVYLKFSLKGILKIVLLSIAVLIPVYFIFKFVSPYTLEYNIAIIKRFLYYSEETAPRKLIAFVNYGESYTRSFLDFFFGSGPGTFNSRSAFMVGSPSFFHVDVIKSAQMPPYFEKFAYPLWNSTNTGPYDGFMNQPFSSILSLLGEYGFLVTATLLTFFITQLVSGHRQMRRIRPNRSNTPESNMYRFTAFYLLVLIVIDNYIEYPEITLVLLLVQKLIYQQEVFPGNLENRADVYPTAMA